MNIRIIAEKIVQDIFATKGQQVNRKDKDTMSDTGGSSKGREREPSIRPPREDLKNRYRTKDKPSNDRDTDTDKDRDKKLD